MLSPLRDYVYRGLIEIFITWSKDNQLKINISWQVSKDRGCCYCTDCKAH